MYIAKVHRARPSYFQIHKKQPNNNETIQRLFNNTFMISSHHAAHYTQPSGNQCRDTVCIVSETRETDTKELFRQLYGPNFSSGQIYKKKYRSAGMKSIPVNLTNKGLFYSITRPRKLGPVQSGFTCCPVRNNHNRKESCYYRVQNFFFLLFFYQFFLNRF